MTNELSIRFKYAYDHLVSTGLVIGYKDFASKIGVSTSMITEIFKGRSNVGVTALQNIVITFRIDGNWLFTGEGDMVIERTSDSPPFANSPPFADSGPVNDASFLYKIYKEKDLEVGALREELGRLKEQIDRLKQKED